MQTTIPGNWVPWTNVTKTGNKLEMKCEGLLSSHTYRFRVTATNDAGMTSGAKEVTGTITTLIDPGK